MELIHLPPDMVPFLDALTDGVEECPGEFDRFLAALEAARRWLEFQGVYSLDDEELRHLENLEVLWREVEQALDHGAPRAVLNALVPPLFQAVSLMTEITNQRQRPHFSPLPAVNDLILAGAAFAQGRGKARGVVERVAMVREYSANLSKLYGGFARELPEPIKVELEKGFDYVEDGLDGCLKAAENEDIELMKDCLSQLEGGASLIGHLLEWQQKRDERLRETHTAYNIPLVGPELELGIRGAHDTPRKHWAFGVNYTLEDVLPRLERFWNMVRPGLLLPAEQRATALLAVDNALEQLRFAVASMLDEAVETEAVLDAVEEALERASEGFSFVEEQAYRTGPLQDSLGGTYAEVIQSVLAGTVPKAGLTELLHSATPPRAWGELVASLTAYLQGGGQECLCDAIAFLVERHVPPAGEALPVPEVWTCVYCGQSNSLGTGSCERCGAHPSGTLDTESWEG